MCCSQLSLCSRRHNAPISEQRLRGQEQEKDVVLPSLEAILVLLCEHLSVHIKQRSTTPRPSQPPSLCFKVARTLHRLQASLRKRLSQDEMANPRNRGQSGDRGLYHIPLGKIHLPVNIARAITYSQSGSSTQHLVILARSQLHTTGHSQIDTMEASPQRSSQPIQEPGLYLMKGLSQSKPQ